MPDSSKTRFLPPSGLTFLFLSISLFQSHFKLLTSAEITPHTWSLAAFTTHPELIRLPSLVAIGIALVSLWKTLRHLYPQTIATLGCLALLSTPAFDDAYDASPYALLLGLTLTALALAVLLILRKAKPASGIQTPTSRPAYGRAIVVILLLLTTWVTFRQARCALLLRRQRHAFFQLRDQVERATAPGEQVLIADPLLLPPLRWYASPALKESIAPFIATRVNTQAESLYIGPLNPNLNLTEHPTTVHWNDLAGVHTPMAAPTTRIYFATPASPLSR